MEIPLYPQEGGVGLKETSTWNKSSIARLVWMLFQNSGSLWIAWIHSNILKKKSFWLVKHSSNSSWIWKKILQLRPVVKPMIKFIVGNGKNILFWQDNGHPRGTLLSVFPIRVIFNSGIPLSAFLFEVLKDSHWCWPSARPLEMLDIQSSAAHIKI